MQESTKIPKLAAEKEEEEVANNVEKLEYLYVWKVRERLFVFLFFRFFEVISNNRKLQKPEKHKEVLPGNQQFQTRRDLD